jgi:hypothetical protein
MSRFRPRMHKLSNVGVPKADAQRLIRHSDIDSVSPRLGAPYGSICVPGPRDTKARYGSGAVPFAFLPAMLALRDEIMSPIPLPASR